MMDASGNFTRTITVTVYDNHAEIEIDGTPEPSVLRLSGRFEAHTRNRQKIVDLQPQSGAEWIHATIEGYERLMGGK